MKKLHVEEEATVSTAMRGNGFYNKNSQVQKANVQFGVPVAIRAASEVPFDEMNEVCNIAEYASSQGRNSLGVISEMIRALKARKQYNPKAHCFEITHTDLPSNDFNSLFHVVNEEEDSYLRGECNSDKNVRFSARSGSFHFQLFRHVSISLGWCSNAIHWMSDMPCALNHVSISMSTDSPDVKNKWVETAKSDYARFLNARYEELIVGGQMIHSEIGATPTQEQAFFGDMIEILKAYVTREELKQIAFPIYFRTEQEFKAPFETEEFKKKFALKEFNVAKFPDPHHDEFLASNDLDAYAKKKANHYAAAALPCLRLSRFFVSDDLIIAKLVEKIKQNPHGYRVDAYSVSFRYEKL